MPMRKARADEADVSTECGITVAPVYGPADVPSFADAIGEPGAYPFTRGNFAGADDTKVVVGGTIPASDAPRLIAIGAAGVFPNGTTIDELVSRMRKLTGLACA